jgi:hypothetical protein
MKCAYWGFNHYITKYKPNTPQNMTPIRIKKIKNAKIIFGEMKNKDNNHKIINIYGYARIILLQEKSY